MTQSNSTQLDNTVVNSTVVDNTVVDNTVAAQTEVNPAAGATLWAIRVHAFGGPEQMRLEQVPMPDPQPGEVRLAVQAAGVLPVDWKIRQGLLRHVYQPPFPYIPGSAVAGIVQAVGPGVTTLQPGDAVFGRSAHGVYAETTTAAAATLARKPNALTFAEAATISGGATTAWNALFENGGLQAGQRVLIHAAAGGVGHFAVQFARIHGAHVIATTSTANLDFVAELGAETVIDYTTTSFEQVVNNVDLVLDALGGDVLRRSMGVVKPGGTLISLLEEPPQDQAARLGIRAMTNSVTQPWPATALLQIIGAALASGQVKATVGRTFTLAEARQAHERSQTGHGRGRIVLAIGDAAHARG